MTVSVLYITHLRRYMLVTMLHYSLEKLHVSNFCHDSISKITTKMISMAILRHSFMLIYTFNNSVNFTTLVILFCRNILVNLTIYNTCNNIFSYIQQFPTLSFAIQNILIIV